MGGLLARVPFKKVFYVCCRATEISRAPSIDINNIEVSSRKILTSIDYDNSVLNNKYIFWTILHRMGQICDCLFRIHQNNTLNDIGEKLSNYKQFMEQWLVDTYCCDTSCKTVGLIVYLWIRNIILDD